MAKVLSPEKTCQHIKNMKGRVVVSRYADGEYILMSGDKSINHATEKSGIISELLRKSIVKSGQFICINSLKKHNSNDVWSKTQKYLIDVSNKEVYGGANWTIYDFRHNCELMPLFFKGKVLLISGNAEKIKRNIDKYRSPIDIYITGLSDVVSHYNKYKSDIFDLIKNKYDNILFACGPIGKVLLADFIDECDSNLIDIGAMGSVIAETTNTWPMSWTKTVDLPKLRKAFFSKL